MESQTVTQCCSGSAQRDFLRGAEACWAGTLHTQLLCQQGKRIEDSICSKSVQLGKFIKKKKKVQNKGVSQPQPGASAE